MRREGKKQQFVQGHQLVGKLILWTLQGLEKKTTANPNVVLDFCQTQLKEKIILKSTFFSPKLDRNNKKSSKSYTAIKYLVGTFKGLTTNKTG